MNRQPGSDELKDIEKALRQRGGFLSRWGLWLILLAVGAGVVGAGWQFTGGGQSDETQANYTTSPAARGELIVRVTATGTIQPTTQVDISSEMSGIVRKVVVDFNSVVKTGDVLAELDRAKLEASVEASRARLSVSLANVQDALASLNEKKLAWDRKQQLAKNDHASKQDLDTARAAYERAAAILTSAYANVDLAKAELKLQETNLERTRIVSPINGVILMRKVDPGQTVASSLQAPVLFTIAEDLTKVEVQVNVDEADVGMVQDGQVATFTVDAYPNRKFGAKVRALRYGSEVVQGVVTYKAILATDNATLLLRPGMTATAEIVVRKLSNALTVPNQALRFSPPQQETQNGGLLQSLIPGRPRFREASRAQAAGPLRRIWILQDGALRPVEVTIGLSDGRRTEILKGALHEGDSIVTAAARRSG